MNWIYLANSLDHLLRLVNKAVNLLVLYNERNFLTLCGTCWLLSKGFISLIYLILLNIGYMEACVLRNL